MLLQKCASSIRNSMDKKSIAGINRMGNVPRMELTCTRLSQLQFTILGSYIASMVYPCSCSMKGQDPVIFTGTTIRIAGCFTLALLCVSLAAGQTKFS